MVIRRTCIARTEHGQSCRQAPLVGAELCFWREPEHAQEAIEARRLGGLRRRREHTLAGAYDVEGLESVVQIRRLLEIATLDTLGLENSVARNLIASATAAARLVEVGELEDRLQALEAAVQARGVMTTSAFDMDPHDPAIAFEAEEGP